MHTVERHFRAIVTIIIILMINAILFHDPERKTEEVLLYEKLKKNHSDAASLS